MKTNYKSLILPDKYIPKVSEKYMCPEHLTYFYKLLISERDEARATLAGDISVMSIGQKIDGMGPMDEGDQATLSMEADLDIKIRERTTNYLAQVEAALERMEKGRFGYSVISGDPIGLKRLLIRPTAAMTMEEKEEHDKKR